MAMLSRFYCRHHTCLLQDIQKSLQQAGRHLVKAAHGMLEPTPHVYGHVCRIAMFKSEASQLAPSQCLHHPIDRLLTLGWKHWESGCLCSLCMHKVGLFPPPGIHDARREVIPVQGPHAQIWVGGLSGETGHALDAAGSRSGDWCHVEMGGPLEARLQQLHRAELQVGTQLEPQHVLARKHDIGYLHTCAILLTSACRRMAGILRPQL